MGIQCLIIGNLRQEANDGKLMVSYLLPVDQGYQAARYGDIQLANSLDSRCPLPAMSSPPKK